MKGKKGNTSNKKSDFYKIKMYVSYLASAKRFSRTSAYDTDE